MADLDEALKKVLPKFNVFNLKTEQRQILECMLERKDCMAVLPTGYGKSLPFQIFLEVEQELRRMRGGMTEQPVTDKIIVCSPLISLMHDQVEKLRPIYKSKVAYKGESLATDQAIQEGHVDIIYASPESLLGDNVWRAKFQNLNVGHLVIDEFHTISSWGEDSDGSEKKAFRKWFSHVGELRSLFPTASVLALSATCTLKIRKRVRNVLSLQAEAVNISCSPNRENIKIILSRVPSSLEAAMCWLVDGISDLRYDFPKTIIYCVSISDASKIYSYLCEEHEDLKMCFELYHSETPDNNKKDIMETFKMWDSMIRIVVATSALGMGIDLQDCASAILYGVPYDVVDLVQEIGRIGRSNEPSVALLLYNSYHLVRSSKEMKNIYKSDSCRRINVMKCFLNEKELSQLEKQSNNHTCCDFCAKNCTCNKCKCLLLESFFQQNENDFLLGDDSDTSSELGEIEISDCEVDEQYIS